MAKPKLKVAPISNMIRNRAGKVLIAHKDGRCLWVHSIDARERMKVNQDWRFVSPEEDAVALLNKSKAQKNKTAEKPIINKAKKAPATPIINKPNKDEDNATSPAPDNAKPRAAAIRK